MCSGKAVSQSYVCHSQSAECQVGMQHGPSDAQPVHRMGHAHSVSQAGAVAVLDLQHALNAWQSSHGQLDDRCSGDYTSEVESTRLGGSTPG